MSAEHKCVMCDQYFYTLSKEGYCRRCEELMREVENQDDGSEYDDYINYGQEE